MARRSADAPALPALLGLAPNARSLKVSAAGVRVAVFCRTYLRQVKGRWQGQPLAFEAWQLAILSELFRRTRESWYSIPLARLNVDGTIPPAVWDDLGEWLRGLPSSSALRVHQEGLIGLARKNGKSTKFSGIALYLLIGDGEPGAEVYAAAAAKDQAKIVFGQARTMVEKSPRLLDHVQVFRDVLYVPKTESIFRAVSADAPLQEGLNPSGIVIDELHAHKTRDLYDTLRSATREQREQPLTVSITTAGRTKRGTILGEVFTKGAGARERYRNAIVVPSKKKPPRFYLHWRGVPDSKRFDRRTWKLANPASWLTLAGIEQDAAEATHYAVFERYYLNRWVSAAKHWLPVGAWDRCRGNGTIVQGDRVVVGVDVGLYHDTAAIVVVKPRDRRDPASKHVVRSTILASWQDPKREPPPAHRYFEPSTPGQPLPYAWIEDAIRTLARDVGLRIVAVGYDPNKFGKSAEDLEGEGFVMIRFDQTDSRMVPASESTYRVVNDRQLEHDGDPVLSQHVDNATAKEVGGARFRVWKGGADDVMDGAVALVVAVGLAEDEEVISASRPSVTVLA